MAPKKPAPKKKPAAKKPAPKKKPSAVDTKELENTNMSVIVSRALPDVKDGLKPVQRRILYSMYETGIRPTGPFRKCSKVVGDVMGNYHPHGNDAIYGTLVRLGQHFSTRYPLIEPQGNFGTPDIRTKSFAR